MAIDPNVLKMVEEVGGQLLGDSNLQQELTNNPAAFIEKMTGKDLPEEQVNMLVKGLMDHVSNNSASAPDEASAGGLESVLGALGGMLTGGAASGDAPAEGSAAGLEEVVGTLGKLFGK